MKNTFYTVIVVLFATIFSVAQETNAQAIPLLTDPIKVRELELMSNKLGMTRPQREAILEVYDRYLEDFARVRAGEITDFENGIADAIQSFRFMQMNIPERSMVEGLIKQAQRAMSAIHRSDTSFFDELSAMLTEKQLVILNRERIARELKAYNIFTTQLMGEFNRGSRSDMRRLFAQLDVDPTIETDDLLDQYDKRYLKEVKKGFNTIIDVVRLVLDQLDELEIRDMDQQELMMRFMADETALEDLKRRGDILLKPLVDQAYVISQLNWSTWKKLDAVLDEERARKLQGFYLKRSFNDSVRGGNKIEGYLDRALSMKGIEQWKKNDLVSLRETFRPKWKKRTMAHASVLEKSRKVKTVAIMSGEVGTEFDEKLAKLKDDRKNYIDATESKINGILGKELVAKLKEDSNTSTLDYYIIDNTVTTSGDSSSGVQVTVSNSGELSDEELAEIAESDDAQATASIEEKLDETNLLFGGATIPKPIATSFPEIAALVVGLDENGALIIGAVFDEYREKYDVINKTISQSSKEIQDDKDLSKGARMRKIRQVSDEAAKSVAMLDTSFFDDLAAIIGVERNNSNLMMLEDHRERQRTAAPDDPFGWMGGEGDTIDLVGLYVMSDVAHELHEGLTEDSVQAIRKAMQGYHEQVADSHNSFVQSMYEMNHLQDAMLLMEESEQSGGETEQFRKRWRDAFINVRDSKRSLLLANQVVMDDLLRNVLENDFWRVRMEFVKKAYPDVFKKGSDLTTMLTAANAIPDLDTTQKSQLDSLTSAYRFDYWNLCESMIENHKSNASAENAEGMMNKEDMHRQLRLETLRFERKELNDRIRMRLRMVLNEEQVKEVPTLRPSVAAADEW